jgi:hypothetical protein
MGFERHEGTDGASVAILAQDIELVNGVDKAGT